jgi:hypothetical protein
MSSRGICIRVVNSKRAVKTCENNVSRFTKCKGVTGYGSIFDLKSPAEAPVFYRGLDHSGIFKFRIDAVSLENWTLGRPKPVRGQVFLDLT